MREGDPRPGGDVRRPKPGVVLLTQNYHPLVGGITTWCHQVGLHLQELGYDVVCVTRAFRGLDDDRVPDVPEVRLPDANWKRDKYWRQLRHILRYDPRDTVFLCANWKMAIVCAVLSLVRPLDFIVAAHGLDVVAHRARDRIRQRWVMKRAKKVIAVSSFTAGLLEQMRLPEGRVEVIPNGVDPTALAPRPPDPAIESRYGIDGPFRLLSLGRLVPRKGFDTTIRALAQAQSDDIEYYIAGTGGYGDALLSLARELGVEERVHLLGFVPNEDLEGLFACVDLFSMPSRRIGSDIEGFGITYLEAAACGVPSIGGRGSGAEDAIVDSETGVLVDPESPAQIAAVLDDARHEPDKYRAMGARARLRVEEELNWDSVARRIAAVIEE